MQAGEISGKIPDYLREIRDGQRQMLDVLDELKPFFVSDDELARVTAVDAIVSLAKGLPDDFLEKGHVNLLLDFFLGCLATTPVNGANIVEAIRHILCNYKNTTPESAEPIFRGLFLDGNVQAWPQKTRGDFYAIFERLVTQYEHVLKPVGSEVTSAFIQAMDGERDPRCLLQVFTLHPLISSKFPVGMLAEDLFEVVACYYPVEFKPLPGQAEITSRSLSNLVEKCFLSNQAFAPYAYVMIEEKLRDEETSHSHRLTICSFLAKAARTYPPKVLIDSREHTLGAVRAVMLDPKNKEPIDTHGPVRDAIIAIFHALLADNQNEAFAAAQEFVQNCEPFILQAEMGLQGKAMFLLEAFTADELNSVPPGQPKIGNLVVECVIAWLLVVARGDTIKVAANKAECIRETLDRLPHFIAVAGKLGMETVLIEDVPAILETFKRAREWAPVESNIAKYQCFKEFLHLPRAEFDWFAANLREELEQGVKIVDSDKEHAEFLAFVTAYSRRSAEWPEFWTGIEESTNEDLPKLFATLCAAVHDAASWDQLRERIFKLLNYENLSQQLPQLAELAERGGEEVAAQVVRNLVDRAKENEKFLAQPEKLDELAAALQEIGAKLEEKHQPLATEFAGLLATSRPLERLLHLFVAQSNDTAMLQNLLRNEKLELSTRALFFYVLANQEAAGIQDIPASLSPADHEIFEVHLIKAGLLNGAWDSGKSAQLEQFLTKLVLGQLAGDATELMTLLFDFTTPKYDPERAKMRRSVLYKQRIFYLFLPVYFKVVEANPGVSCQMRLVKPIHPLLQYAKQVDGAGESLEKLVPLLVTALAHPPDASEQFERTQFLATLGTLMAVADLKEKPREQLEMLVAIFGRELEDAEEVETCLATLDGLETLAKKANAGHIMPHCSKIVVSAKRLTAHKKRTVRQKAATVINLWELLVLKV